MKKFLVLAALALMTVGFASQAEARWNRVPINWLRANTTTNGVHQQFDVTTGADAKVDTTATFTLDIADIPPIVANKIAVGSTDTTVIAKVIVYGDSSTASTISFKSAAFAVQANAGFEASGWQTVYTYSSLNTDGQKYVEIPIWMHRAATISRDLYIDRTGDLSMFGVNLRIIATLTGATAVPTMRAKLVYWSQN